MLRFINYVVNESKFKLNPIPQGVVNFAVNPGIRMDIKKEGANFSLATTITISTSEAHPTPFDLEVKATANFRVEGEESVDEMRVKASELFYPYLRAYVTTLTANANVPSYSLPVIDFRHAIPVANRPNSSNNAKSHIDSIKIRPIDEV